jgi:N-acetylneuraminate synthase
MATVDEIREALGVLREGSSDILLLKCTASYPAPLEDMNLNTIADMSATFGLPVGLSDHSMKVEVPVAAVALGACAIEKHLTLARSDGGPDSAFSLEPHEFKATVDAVRNTERALGLVQYGPTASEAIPRLYRRSLFVVADMRAGERFSEQNVRSIRPGHGLHTRHLPEILGKQASRDIVRGTPLGWELVS